MNKAMAFLVFVSSCVSAACLGLMAFTFTTGDIPFGIKPLISYESKKEKTLKEKEEKMTGKPGAKQRNNEEWVTKFYNDVMKQKAIIDDEKEKVADEKRQVEQLSAQVKIIQEKLKARESELRKLIEKIKAEDLQRFAKLAKLIGGMDTAQATTMLLAFDDKMACRILSLMNQKTASKIISDVIKSGDDKKIERMKKLADDMSKLNEDLSNE